jgi:hypothetical protein
MSLEFTLLLLSIILYALKCCALLHHVAMTVC